MRRHDYILALLVFSSAAVALTPAAAQMLAVPESTLVVPPGSDPAFDVPPGWTPGPPRVPAPPPPASPQRLTPPPTFTDVALGEDDYPPESFGLGEQGIVRSRFLLTETGEATGCTIEATSGYPRLDEAACGLVTTRRKYRPKSDGTSAVATLITVNLLFSMAPRRPPVVGDPTLNVPEMPREVTAVPPLIETLLIPPVPVTSHTVTADDYPWESIRLQEQGVIGLLFFVGETGDVYDCAVTVSSGHARLDAAARAMVVNRWKYKPATLDGQATAVIISANVVFRLR